METIHRSDKQQIDIKKSNIEKLVEFFHAIRIIQDSRKLINEGKYYQITPIYGQLRSLLTDKTKDRTGESKPLFEIGKILNEDLNIYYLPDTLEQDVPSIKDKLILFVSTLPISVKKQLSQQQQISFADYLNIEAVKYKGKVLKVSDIINVLSNKYGGSHYDSKVPDYLFELTNFGINNQPILDNFILQIADLFVEVGLNLIRKISDFEIYLTLFIESVSSEENIIFDYTLPNTNARISFYAHHGKFKLLLCDLIGRSVNLEIKELISTKTLQLINVTHKVTNELTSQVTVSIEGLTILDVTTKEPLLMLNDIISYQGYINRSKEKESQDFEFGLGELAITGGIQNFNDKINVFSYFTQKKRGKIAFFHNKSYGHCAPGTTDLKMVGNVKVRKLNNSA